MSIFFSYFNLLYIELYSCQISLENNKFFCEVTVGILAPPPQSSNSQKCPVLTGLNGKSDGG